MFDVCVCAYAHISNGNCTFSSIHLLICSCDRWKFSVALFLFSLVCPLNGGIFLSLLRPPCPQEMRRNKKGGAGGMEEELETHFMCALCCFGSSVTDSHSFIIAELCACLCAGETYEFAQASNTKYQNTFCLGLHCILCAQHTHTHKLT